MAASAGEKPWSEVGDHPSMLLRGPPPPESLCHRERAGLDGKAQLSAVLKFPLKGLV